VAMTMAHPIDRAPRARVLSSLLLVGLIASVGACARKPTESECTAAVENIRRLTGQDRAEGGMDPKSAVRSCRSRSSLATVGCQTKAQTLDELAGCEGAEGKAILEERRKREAERETPPAAAPTPPATPAP
jgi:hypothetical protein